MKAASGLVHKFPSGLPPLPHLNVALSLYECLSHWESDDLDNKTSDKVETDRGSEDNKMSHNRIK